jgi:beta-barrel assembly-enhancing protease
MRIPSTFASSCNACRRGTWTRRTGSKWPAMEADHRRDSVGLHMKHQEWHLALVCVCLLSGLQMAAQDNQATPSQAREDQKRKHIAAKDNIQAIGIRKIGGRGVGNWYSVEQEIGIGRDYSRVIESNNAQLRDPVIAEYVNRIGQNIVRHSDAKVPFTIKVLDSEEINAFALPGGFLYVNTGLLVAAHEEAELAGVMAHEIAHVAAHHATRQMTHSQLLNLATVPLIFVGGGIGLAVQEAARIAAPLTLTKFSRTFEAEADYLGVEYLYQAGYDPNAFISFFERVQALEKQKPGAISKMFSNHPQTSDRIRKTQSEIVRILPPREAYVISTSDFDEMKSRLAAIENRRQAREQEQNRPTLRHKTSGDQGNPERDDERPTLKRRSN